MTEPGQQESGWRGSPDLWVNAAYETLIDQGVDAVKILTLGARLKLSRTSFYWFFKDRQALLEALADRWDAATTRPLVTAARAYAATETEAMLNVIGCFLSDRSFDARLEFAVRGWALQDARMLARVHAADTLRLQALSAMLGLWGHDALDADVRARTIYLVQIGYIAMQTRETTETRLQRIPKYVEIYTGRPPSADEMARFKAHLLTEG